MDWSLGPKLPNALWGHCSVIFGGNLVVIGGWNTSPRQIGQLSSLQSVQWIDFNGRAWNSMPSLRTGRSTHGCAVTNFKVHILFYVFRQPFKLYGLYYFYYSIIFLFIYSFGRHLVRLL